MIKLCTVSHMSGLLVTVCTEFTPFCLIATLTDTIQSNTAVSCINTVEKLHVSSKLSSGHKVINPLNAELNPIRHLLALVGARHIVHVSRTRVKH